MEAAASWAGTECNTVAAQLLAGARPDLRRPLEAFALRFLASHHRAVTPDHLWARPTVNSPACESRLCDLPSENEDLLFAYFP